MTTATQTLAEFISDRIADDEAAAKAAIEASGESGSWWVDGPAASSGKFWVYATGEKFSREPVAQHIARHDPARVLAQCKAYRAIVERFATGDDIVIHPIVAALAAIWSDHKDYRAGEWAL